MFQRDNGGKRNILHVFARVCLDSSRENYARCENYQARAAYGRNGAPCNFFGRGISQWSRGESIVGR